MLKTKMIDKKIRLEKNEMAFLISETVKKEFGKSETVKNGISKS